MQLETIAAEIDPRVKAVIGETLTLEAFAQLCGNLAGYPFIKVVVDRERNEIHFINNARYAFHGHYIAENLLGITPAELEREIDKFNQSVYLDPNRRFYLGILAFHSPSDPKAARDGQSTGAARRFFSLETVEIDSMDATMVRFFYGVVKAHLDPSVPLFFKPANHLQETIVATLAPEDLPRIFSHEIFSSARFVALNAGKAQGRIRAFKTTAEYKRAASTLEWFDIIVMHRVPDDIPRVSGIINAHATTPLSHTNVLAYGWQIPNAIQLGVFDRIDREGLDGKWVDYSVESSAGEIALRALDGPIDIAARPAWSVQEIKLEEPETVNTPIASLEALRMSDRYRYGTKAANLGELKHVLDQGSERLLGFYRIRRPPRPNLLSHLAKLLHAPDEASLAQKASEFLKAKIQIPRGIALPFSVQQEFLEGSPRIQQAIGKLKMALELNAREIEPLCLSLQALIRQTRMPEKLRGRIDSRIAQELSGVSSFVVRSSSNAEDLAGFSAAGIYESINHVSTADNVFASIKEVWASLLSPRSVRLRQQAGISLDDCYMGVIVQEEVPSELGGVLVTTNPMNRGGDFRNVYINVSAKSVTNIVQGAELPYQYLYNTVEGGGRTLSIGDAERDLDERRKAAFQDLALAGRLLQSHFSPDYTFSAPVDIEWILNPEGLFVLQLRPYGK